MVNRLVGRRIGDLPQIFSCPAMVGIIILAYGLAFAYHKADKAKKAVKPQPIECKVYNSKVGPIMWCPRKIKGV